MKIDDTLSGAHQVNALNRAQQASEVSSAAKGKPDSGSKAEPSTGKDSATLGAGAALASRMAHVSDVRTDKVTSVQQALAAGTYHVDAGKVADKIIASMTQKS